MPMSLRALSTPLLFALSLAACSGSGSGNNDTSTVAAEPAGGESAGGAEAEPAAAASTEAVDEAPAPEPVAAPEPEPVTAFDVGTWDTLLGAYVVDGGFRYAALAGDEDARARLAEVVSAIGSAAPDEWPRDAQLAYYVNAYNALTVSAVVERWPLTSVMNVEGFFDAVAHRVAGQTMTLNALENDIIRARFGEPRIHFAVNCASVGCPALMPTAFTADNLEAQLAAGAQAYVRGTSRLDRRRRRVAVSKIFEWFATDFEAGGGVRAFLVAQLEGDDARFVENARTRITHFDYDWNVNARE